MLCYCTWAASQRAHTDASLRVERMTPTSRRTLNTSSLSVPSVFAAIRGIRKRCESAALKEILRCARLRRREMGASAQNLYRTRTDRPGASRAPNRLTIVADIDRVWRVAPYTRRMPHVVFSSVPRQVRQSADRADVITRAWATGGATRLRRPARRGASDPLEVLAALP
jgi:hypothetical protein